MLTLPLLLRCLLDFGKEFEWYNNFWNATDSRNTTYNLLFFTFTTYGLIILQCATLIFGLVRASTMKEYKSTKEMIKKEAKASMMAYAGPSPGQDDPRGTMKSD